MEQDGNRADISRFASEYKDRLQKTPSDKKTDRGIWAGDRGESIYMPMDERVKEILSEKSLDGIQYREGVPDFSPVAHASVEIGHMLGVNSSGGGRYSSGVDPEAVIMRTDEATDPNDPDVQLANGMMKYEYMGNFDQADIALAKQWGCSSEEVESYRKDNHLTWHECNDMATMQLVPSEINQYFGHLGGVSEKKQLDQYAHEDEEDEWVDDSEIDSMSEEELAKFAAHEEGEPEFDMEPETEELSETENDELEIPPETDDFNEGAAPDVSDSANSETSIDLDQELPDDFYIGMDEQEEIPDLDQDLPDSMSDLDEAVQLDGFADDSTISETDSDWSDAPSL